MSQTGRYWVVAKDKQGRLRKFCVEPLHERNQKEDDVAFRNGGLDGNSVKKEVKGGSISPEDSIITAENGFSKSIVLPPGVSPEDWIREQCEASDV